MKEIFTMVDKPTASIKPHQKRRKAAKGSLAPDISEGLRLLYKDVVEEPIPAELLDLLKSLDDGTTSG